MGNQVAKLESQFSRLASMGSVVKDAMKAAKLMSSLTNCSDYALMTALGSTMQE